MLRCTKCTKLPLKSVYLCFVNILHTFIRQDSVTFELFFASFLMPSFSLTTLKTNTCSLFTVHILVHMYCVAHMWQGQCILDRKELQLSRKNNLNPCQASCLWVNDIMSAHEFCRLGKFWPCYVQFLLLGTYDQSLTPRSFTMEILLVMGNLWLPSLH